MWLTCGALPRHYLLIVSSIATACPSPICRVCGEKCLLNAVDVCFKRMGRMGVNLLIQALLMKLARQKACPMSGIVRADRCRMTRTANRVTKQERIFKHQASNVQDLLHLQGQGDNLVPMSHGFLCKPKRRSAKREPVKRSQEKTLAKVIQR